jgi:glucans biosynthesis protein C
MASQTKAGPSLPTGATGIARPFPPDSAPAGTHLWFLDHLRLVLICGVVVAHVASIYVGGWYQYHDPVPADAPTTIALVIPNMLADTFGLGFFFLIAGLLTPGSYDRKGGASFLRDRLVRLGIPLLVYDLLLDPLVVYIARGLHGSYWSFYGPYLLHVRTIGPEVAWFLSTLLLFTLLYVAWRALARSRPHAAEREASLPSTRAILGFILALGLLTFVVRIWWPAGSWWQPLNLLMGYLPQHFSFFVLGCLAYRRNWFLALTPRMGRDWSLIALATLLVASLLILSLLIVGGVGAAGTQMSSFVGGFHWQALVEAMGEAFLAVGVCLGLLVLFRERWNRQGRLAKSLAASAYTVYLIHPLVAVGFASAFSTVALYPLLKFVIAALLVLPLSFLVGLVLRTLPLANRIL